MINLNQTGGITDRDIFENLCLIRNVILDKEKGRGAAIVGLDFQKAYDSVNRDLIYKIMEKFNFPDKFIGWIKTLYSNSYACVLLNGKLGNKIDLNRGLKQGCPLSLYLYLIYIEPLHLFLQSQTRGISFGNRTLKTSGFVDDVIFFTEREEDLIILENVLNRFELATNSKINKSKTKFLALGGWSHKTSWPLPSQTEQPVPWTSMAGSKRAERPTSILGPKGKEHLVLGEMQ